MLSNDKAQVLQLAIGGMARFITNIQQILFNVTFGALLKLIIQFQQLVVVQECIV